MKITLNIGCDTCSCGSIDRKVVDMSLGSGEIDYKCDNCGNTFGISIAPYQPGDELVDEDEEIEVVEELSWEQQRLPWRNYQYVITEDHTSEELIPKVEPLRTEGWEHQSKKFNLKDGSGKVLFVGYIKPLSRIEVNHLLTSKFCRTYGCKEIEFVTV